ncbi:MAG: iron-sulfur cluster carrier protein ApbC [Burkholderiales bacterium]|nr:iron-sulfur cluster carrier protein ApbC [Burkholderiales bacterium]
MTSTPRSALETTAVEALKTVHDPLTGQDWVSGKQLKSLRVDEQGQATVEIALGYPATSLWPAYTAQVSQALLAVPGVAGVDVHWTTQIQTHATPKGQTPLPGVKNLIGIASGKGGVGKSTTAINLALALAAEGARVGMMDADIYGPSQPLMMGLSGRPDSPDGKSIEPLRNHGLQMMSIGLLIDENAPTIWRGPMATQAVDQLLRQTRWGAPDAPLDYLIIDMPPGTGDIHLTLCQRAPLTAAVIVTTPQDIALLDARKGLKMFEKVGVPVLGVVENMATYHCPNCGHEEHIFGADGGKRLAQETGVPVLGSMPLDLKIREQADRGQPTLVADPHGRIAGLYKDIAQRLAAGLSRLPKDYSGKLPGVTVVS